MESHHKPDIYPVLDLLVVRKGASVAFALAWHDSTPDRLISGASRAFGNQDRCRALLRLERLTNNGFITGVSCISVRESVACWKSYLSRATGGRLRIYTWLALGSLIQIILKAKDLIGVHKVTDVCRYTAYMHESTNRGTLRVSLLQRRLGSRLLEG
jgi:hypothetical protein